MLNRRHIRTKVMQSIYAMQQQGNDNLQKQEKYLFYSIENCLDLHLLLLDIFIQLKEKEELLIEANTKKHLATPEDKNPNRKFVNNIVLNILANQQNINKTIEINAVLNWRNNDDFILYILKKIKETNLYQAYMLGKTQTLERDKNFLIDIYTEIIAPNERLYEYLEDTRLSWIDDFAMINTLIVKELNNISYKNQYYNFPTRVYKDIADKEYAQQLFRKTVLNDQTLLEAFEYKTPNWDTERIAEVDMILIKMAIAELLYFPSIPTKVTINEYVEIAKEYCTPNSSIFINGVLDTLVKEYTQTGKIEKIGRGLL